MSNLINSYWEAAAPPGDPNWDEIGSASDDSIFLDSSPDIGTSCSVVRASPDGTKIYVGGWTNDAIHQYSGTAFADIDTFSYDSKSKDFTTDCPNMRGFVWGDSGNKCYVCGITNNTVYQYSASTPYDISTVGTVQASFASSANLFEVMFKTDGTEMYLFRSGNLMAYPLSTPWDISTAGTILYTRAFAASNTVGFWLNPNGQQIIHTNSTTKVSNMTYATAWDFDVGYVETSTFTAPTPITNVHVWSDNSKIMISNRVDNDVHQWSFS